MMGCIGCGVEEEMGSLLGGGYKKFAGAKRLPKSLRGDSSFYFYSLINVSIVAWGKSLALG